jgi:hypothetical protein
MGMIWKIILGYAIFFAPGYSFGFFLAVSVTGFKREAPEKAGQINE